MSKYGKQQICTLRSFFICNTFCFMLCVGIIFIKIFTDEVNPPIRLTVAALRMHNTSEVAGISPISANLRVVVLRLI
ncbi:hypothetical protein ECP03048168_3870 [Escherichia coli P0304816.8]|nr:hypothetical protein ECP030481610_1764 [Escherichia coli P0304816.10]ENF66250.1 hypothetical protein ECP03048168_3870 [Escherichia coli P0304816.8]ENH36144.1 hypothetical protein ECP03048164_0825 [Escherichia coli P0304816.4]